MTYNNYNLNIQSDIEIRVVHEDQWDMDLLVPIDYRTLRLSSTLQNKGLFEGIQFPSVYGVLIRIAKSKDNNCATIHVLRNIDLNSSVANFELNYEHLTLSLNEYDLFCNLAISGEA